VAENAEPGWLICTAVDTEVDSDRAIEIPPVEKSTTNVTDAVCVAEEVADTLPASEDAATLIAAASLSEKVMYSLLPRWYSCAAVPGPRLLKPENSPLVPKMVDFLYGRLQRRGYLRRDVERMINQVRSGAPIQVQATGKPANRNWELGIRN